MSAAIVSLSQVSKQYDLGKVKVHALSAVDVELVRGDFVVFAGPSGSGKTTLLNLIGCVDIPSQGTVCIDGQDTSALSDRGLTKLRRFKLGFIFQSFNLIPVLTAAQNVEFPLLLQRTLGKKDRQQRVREILTRVGLEKYLRHRPGEMSGGQQQRVAIARALVTQPKIILADEPTANLDSVTGADIVKLMQQINTEHKTTFVLSTHDHSVMEQANRVIRLVDGKIAAA